MENEPIVWTAKVRKVSELRNYERNPRKIDEQSYTRLLNRIRTRGFHDVIKLDTEDNILSGNQRKRALTELGVEKVNTLSPSRPLTEEEKRAVIVESNRSDGFFDFEILAADYSVSELLSLGFNEKELDVVDFSELDGVSIGSENEEFENKKYELIFENTPDYLEFLTLIRKVQEMYVERSLSDSLLTYLRDNVTKKT